MSDELREQIRCITGECFHHNDLTCLYNDADDLPSYYQTDKIMSLITQLKKGMK
jgi:hypothetical protein